MPLEAMGSTTTANRSAVAYRAVLAIWLLVPRRTTGDVDPASGETSRCARRPASGIFS